MHRSFLQLPLRLSHLLTRLCLSLFLHPHPLQVSVLIPHPLQFSVYSYRQFNFQKRFQLANWEVRP